MIQDTFLRLFEGCFPHTFTAKQREAAEQLTQFVLTPDARATFVLRGYAGTGKTSLMSALVRTLRKLERNVVLMAPTGRAAKVFTQYADHPAYTIHKVIYRQKKKDDLGAGFALNYNKFRHTLFIVDEASMISTSDGNGRSLFGTGRLLDDLLTFVYDGLGCRVMFVGDTAQLPPVGEIESPALNPALLSVYGLNVTACELTEVMRQAAESGILSNATALRCAITAGNTSQLPQITFHGFPDLRNVPGGELIDALEQSYDRCGTSDTIVVTRSNKRAVVYNNGIRSTIFGRDTILERGDMLMVAKNNYYWTELLSSRLQRQAKETGSTTPPTVPMDFIANGDLAEVVHIAHRTELYGLHFADVTLRFPDFDNFEIDVRIILDALQSESPSLDQESSQRLYEGVMADYADYPTRRKRMEKLRDDPNYNALQVKYAYAVTCHKAQGGQWQHVYVDQGWLPPDGIDASYYRWLYTAFTRTSQQLFLVNWPDNQTNKKL